MKIIIIVVTLLMLLFNLASAGETIKVDRYTTVTTICLNGYLYAVAFKNDHRGGVSITQMTAGKNSSGGTQLIYCDGATQFSTGQAKRR